MIDVIVLIIKAKTAVLFPLMFPPRHDNRVVATVPSVAPNTIYNELESEIAPPPAIAIITDVIALLD